MSLPPLYSIDDYWSCVGKGDTFCTIGGLLSSTTSSNAIWDQIQVNVSNRMLFDRSFLHRAICIPIEYSTNQELQKQYSENYLNNEIVDLNLTASIKLLSCLETRELRNYDYAVLLAMICYFAFVTAVSVCDRWIVKHKNSQSLIWNFSIFHNWNKIVYAKNSRDFEKLKGIQGLRFYLMFNNIMIHSMMSYCVVYLDDPTYLEQIAGTKYAAIFTANIPHIVQPFFLISSWLCTLQIYNTYEDNGKFTFKDLVITVVNRYFRLIPSVAFMIVIITTNWMSRLMTSPHTSITRAIENACRTNSLPTLLFANNYLFAVDMCNPVTWYLSADFQLYIITSLTVYLILKYKWNVAKVLAIGIFLSIFANGALIYALNLDMIFRPYIRSIELVHFLESVAFKTYTSTHTSLATAFLGIMFGFIYVKNRHRTDLHENKTLVTMFYILFYGLWPLVLYLTTKHFNHIISAILGPLMKPLYGFAFGVFILGLSHNIGGTAKRILEWRFFEIMGNFSFGAYNTHVLIVFGRGFMRYTLYPSTHLVMDSVLDLILSFATGALLSLTVEQPAAALQKKILPQVKKKAKYENESKKNGIPANEKEKTI